VVAGGDDVGAHVEDLFGEGGRDAEASGGVFAIDDKEVDGVGFEDVGEMLAYDVAAGGAEDVADEEDVHLEILHWVVGRGRSGGKEADPSTPRCAPVGMTQFKNG